MKILLLENIHSVAKDRLEKEGFSVELASGALGESELIEKLKSFDALGIRSKTQITQQVLENSKHLQCIGAFCIGTNQIDLDQANAIGTPVFNAPYSNTRSVAELILGEIISLARKFSYISSLAHEGKWLKSAVNSHEVRGKTLGIVGYGHIGSQVSVLAEALGMNVVYYDIIKKLPLGNSSPCESLEQLLEISDFVSLHVPETELTRNRIGTTELARMKKGAYLLNASRGTVVDIPALAKALKEKQLSGAAVDVFPEEPKNNDEKFLSELQGLENVILTPHIGGSTEEAQEAIGHEVSESIVRYLKEGFTGGAVNFPIVESPVNPNYRRIVNIHHNVPGVLSEVNRIVSSIGANIFSQHLNTDSRIGYLVMDVQPGHGEELRDQISQLKTSIKTRLIG